MATRDDIVAIVANFLELSPERVASAESLIDLDVDSLALVDVIFELEKILGVELPDRELREVNSIDDLVRVVDLVRGVGGQRGVNSA